MVNSSRYRFALVDGDIKVFADEAPLEMDHARLDIYRNDKVSFQLAYTMRYLEPAPKPDLFRISVEVEGVSVVMRNIELVPCNFVATGRDDDFYIRKTPGMYPDRLEASDGVIRPIVYQWRAVRIDLISSAVLSSGSVPVTVKVLSEEGEVVFCRNITLVCHDLQIEKLSCPHTEWFHTDCLADYYNTDVFSEKHWQIIENFISFAVKESCCNMIYTPIFTPSLDTAVGGERTTVQLVKVKETSHGYEFDFSLLDRWCSLLKKYGVEYVEVAHLFTQWGAKTASKVMAETTDGYKRIFGWETPSSDSRYISFLEALIPELISRLNAHGYDNEHIYFHISDEPDAKDLESYLVAKKGVWKLISSCRVFDALSSYELYEKKAVELPVVSADHIDTFIENGVKDLWVYYCVGQGRDVVNRFVVHPGWRTRALGILMYYFDIKGFLHWGFNFYNSQYSLKHINPYLVTDSDKSFPSGDPFLVYPGEDLKPESSIRNELNSEAFRDFRLLETLEKEKGRAYVTSIIEEAAGGPISFRDYPQNLKFIHDVIGRVNAEL